MSNITPMEQSPKQGQDESSKKLSLTSDRKRELKKLARSGKVLVSPAPKEVLPELQLPRNPDKEREELVAMIRNAKTPEEAREIFDAFKVAEDMVFVEEDFEALMREREIGAKEQNHSVNIDKFKITGTEEVVTKAVLNTPDSPEVGSVAVLEDSGILVNKELASPVVGREEAEESTDDKKADDNIEEEPIVPELYDDTPLDVRAARVVFVEKIKQIGERIDILRSTLGAKQIGEALKDHIVDGLLDTNDPEITILIEAKSKRRALEKYVRTIEYLEADLLEIARSANPKQNFNQAYESGALRLFPSEFKKLKEAIEVRELDLLIEKTEREIAEKDLPVSAMLKEEGRKYREEESWREELKDKVRRLIKRARSKKKIDRTEEDVQLDTLLEDLKKDPSRLESYRRLLPPNRFEELQERIEDEKEKDKKNERKAEWLVTFSEIKEFIDGDGREPGLKDFLLKDLADSATDELNLSEDSFRKLKRLSVLFEEIHGLVEIPRFDNIRESGASARAKSITYKVSRMVSVRKEFTRYKESRTARGKRDREYIAALAFINEFFQDRFEKLSGDELRHEINKLYQTRKLLKRVYDPREALGSALRRGCIESAIYHAAVAVVDKVFSKKK